MASAASTGTSTPTNRQHNRECPVCFRVFRVPKMLRCGHSICSECADRLKSPVGNIECPVCRSNTNAIAGLPTNFALQNLIEESTQERPKYRCEECSRRHPLEDMWSCKTCSLMVACANCIVKAHRDHDVQGMKDLLESRQREFEQWRQNFETTHGQFSNRQVELENSLRQTYRLGCNFGATIRNNLMPLLSNSVRSASAAGNSLVQGAREADVSELTANGRYETYLKEAPRMLRNLTDKQDRIQRDIVVAQDVIQNSLDVVRQLLDRFRQSGVGAEAATEPNGPRRTEASGGTAAETGPVDGAGHTASAQVISPIDWPILIDDETEIRPESRRTPIRLDRHSEERDLANALPPNAAFYPLFEDEISIEEEPEVEQNFGLIQRQQLSDVRRTLERHLGNSIQAVAFPRAAATVPRHVGTGGIGRGIPITESPTVPGSLGGIGRGSGRGRGRGAAEVEYLPIGGIGPIRGQRLIEGSPEALPSSSGAVPSDSDDA